MTREFFAAGGNEEIMEVINGVPAGRYAQPEELAAAVLFLSSEHASFCHGAVFVADGGWTIR